MQVNIQCPICKFGVNRKRKLGDEKLLGGISYSPLPNTDNNIIQHSCLQHNFIVFLDNKKFDLLFESGILAMKDLYYREAVASLASSLERFYEVCIQVLAKDSCNQKMFDSTWKLVSRQSERQLGAFLFLYLSEFNSEPPVLDNKKIEFRNNVIHKGYFPDEAETKEFLFATAEIILTTYKKLVESKRDELEQISQNFVKGIESAAQLKILQIEQTPGYDNRSKYRMAKHPFKRTLPTFVSNIDSHIPSLEELHQYMENSIDRKII